VREKLPLLRGGEPFSWKLRKENVDVPTGSDSSLESERLWLLNEFLLLGCLMITTIAYV
jgi:hypothetical protein